MTKTTPAPLVLDDREIRCAAGLLVTLSGWSPPRVAALTWSQGAEIPDGPVGTPGALLCWWRSACQAHGLDTGPDAQVFPGLVVARDAP